MLIEQYPSETQAILAKYPPTHKRAALMPLLHLAQRESGYVSQDAIREIAAICEIEPTEVASIVGFYTLYYDQPAGKYRIQVCTDLPCALRGAQKFLDELCQNLAIKVGETTPDGVVIVEAVKCLAGCDHAPMFQVQSGSGIEYHENQTVESALALVESYKRAHAEASEAGGEVANA
jgi:NADH-quinone oxidoreductase subunit E